MGAGTGGGAFGNSKFFLKKQNRAATQIQSLIRTFLVQARLFRQRVLEPRRRELLDCQVRKTEELRRIQEQMQEERQGLPAVIRQEMEASTVLVEQLKQEVEEFTRANERIKEERKEERRKHKELDTESRQLKDSTFRVDVQTTKLTAEIKERQETADKYAWAVKDGTAQMEELETALLKVCYQQGVLKRYINKIIKMVDEKAKEHGSHSTASSPPSSPKQQPQRRKSLHRNKSNKQGVKKRNSSIKSDVGNASFNWETYDGKPDPAADICVEDLIAHHPDEEQACFDWATKSYAWANQSLEELGDEVAKEVAPARKARRQSKPHEDEKKCDEERRSRRHSKPSAGIDKAAKQALKELVHELKALKKQGLKQ